MLVFVRNIHGHPRMELCTQREAGLGAAQGQSLLRPAQSPGSIPSTTKIEERKSVTKKAAVNVRAALGEPRTAGKVEREPSQSSRHLENAFPTLSLHFLYSIGCYTLYK